MSTPEGNQSGSNDEQEKAAEQRRKDNKDAVEQGRKKDNTKKNGHNLTRVPATKFDPDSVKKKPGDN